MLAGSDWLECLDTDGKLLPVISRPCSTRVPSTHSCSLPPTPPNEPKYPSGAKHRRRGRHKQEEATLKFCKTIEGLRLERTMLNCDTLYMKRSVERHPARHPPVPPKSERHAKASSPQHYSFSSTQPSSGTARLPATNIRSALSKRSQQLANSIALKKLCKIHSGGQWAGLSTEIKAPCVSTLATSAEEQAVVEHVIRDSDKVKTIDCKGATIHGKKAKFLVNVLAQNKNIMEVSLEGAVVSDELRNVIDVLISRNKKTKQDAKERRLQKKKKIKLDKQRAIEAINKQLEKREYFKQKMERSAKGLMEQKHRAKLEEREAEEWGQLLSEQLEARQQAVLLTVQMTNLRNQQIKQLVCEQEAERNEHEVSERQVRGYAKVMEIRRREDILNRQRAFEKLQAEERKVVTTQETEARRAIRMQYERILTGFTQQQETEYAVVRIMQRERENKQYELERAAIRAEAQRRQLQQEQQSARNAHYLHNDEVLALIMSAQEKAWGKLLEEALLGRLVTEGRTAQREAEEKHKKRVRMAECILPELHVNPMQESCQFVSGMISGECVFASPCVELAVSLVNIELLSDSVQEYKQVIRGGSIRADLEGYGKVLLSTGKGVSTSAFLYDDDSTSSVWEDSLEIVGSAVMLNSQEVAEIEKTEKSLRLNFLKREQPISCEEVQLLLRYIAWQPDADAGGASLSVSVELEFMHPHSCDAQQVDAVYIIKLDVLPSYIGIKEEHLKRREYVEESGPTHLVSEICLRMEGAVTSLDMSTPCHDVAVPPLLIVIDFEKGWTPDDRIFIKGDLWSLDEADLHYKKNRIFTVSGDVTVYKESATLKKKTAWERLEFTTTDETTLGHMKRLLHSLVYLNSSKDPVPGNRDITLMIANIETWMTCGAVVKLAITAVDDPTTLEMCVSEVQYKVKNGDLPPSVQQYTQEQQPVLLAPRAIVADPDTTYFKGGWFSAQLGGAFKGDVLVIRESDGLSCDSETGLLSCCGEVLGTVRHGMGRGDSDRIGLEFSPEGTGNIDAVQQFVRSLAFVNTLAKPKLGPRTVTINMIVGDPSDTDVLRKYDPHIPIEGKVVVNVIEPIITIPLDKASMTHREGGVSIIPPISLMQETEKDWNELYNVVIKVKVVCGAGIEDLLALKEVESPDWFTSRACLEDSLVIRSSKSAETSEGAFSAGDKWQTMAAKQRKRAQEATEKLQAVTSAAQSVTTYELYNDQKQYFGNWKTQNKGELIVTLGRKKKTDHLRRKDVQQVLRSISYELNTSNPCTLKKVLCVMFEDVHGHGSQCLIDMSIQEVDDVTEIHRPGGPNQLLQYRQGTQQYAIAHNACLYDPDSFHFNGGLVSCQLISGGDQGDQLGLLPVECQKEQCINAASSYEDTPEWWDEQILIEQRGKRLYLLGSGEGRLIGSIKTESKSVVDKTVKKNPSMLPVSALTVYLITEDGNFKFPKKASERLKQAAGKKQSQISETVSKLKKQQEKEEIQTEVEKSDGAKEPQAREGALDDSETLSQSSDKLSDATSGCSNSDEVPHVTLLMAQHVMRCFTYKNITKASKLKPGVRSYLIKIGPQGCNEYGKLKVNINVTAPLIYQGDFNIDTVYTERSGPMIINPKVIVNVPAEKQFNSGYIEIAITSGLSECDAIGLPTTGFSVKGGKSLFCGPTTLVGCVSTHMRNDYVHKLRVIFDNTCKMTGKILQQLIRSVTFSNDSHTPDDVMRVVTFSVTDKDGAGDVSSLTTEIGFQAIDDMTEIELSKHHHNYVKGSKPFKLFPDVKVTDSDTPVFDTPGNVEIIGSQSDCLSIENEGELEVNWNQGNITWDETVIATMERFEEEPPNKADKKKPGAKKKVKPLQKNERQGVVKIKLLLVECSLSCLEALLRAVTFFNNGRSEHTARKTIRLIVRATNEVTPTKVTLTVDLVNPLVDYSSCVPEVQIEGYGKPAEIVPNFVLLTKNVQNSTFELCSQHKSDACDLPPLPTAVIRPQLIFHCKDGVTRKGEDVYVDKEKLGVLTEQEGYMKFEVKKKNPKDMQPAVQRVGRCFAAEMVANHDGMPTMDDTPAGLFRGGVTEPIVVKFTFTDNLGLRESTIGNMDLLLHHMEVNLRMGNSSESGSASDSGSGDNPTMQAICITLAIIYGLLWMRSIQVIINFLRMSHGSVNDVAESAPLAANDCSANYGLSGSASLVPPQPQHTEKRNTSASGKVMFHFYSTLCFLSLSRMVTWSVSAGVRNLESSNVQLAVVAIPSLFYFVMLYILVNSWWCAYDALIATTGNPEEQHSIQSRMRKPAMVLMSLLWLVTIILYVYLITSEKLTTGSTQQNIMLGYTGGLFLIIGMLFIRVGSIVHKKLGELPYNYPGTQQLKKKVFRITVFIGPSCILRAIFTVFQIAPDNNFLSRFVNGDYFPLAFYMLFEVLPILGVMSTLQAYYRGEDDENEPPAPAISPSRQVTVAPGIASRVTVDAGGSARGSLQPALNAFDRHAASAPGGLNLKVGGRTSIGNLGATSAPVIPRDQCPAPKASAPLPPPPPPPPPPQPETHVPTAHSCDADKEDDHINRSSKHYLQA